ncbi:hypothetical protein DFH29DRAFT_235955 [Suillus ampliporus]|nr:hypothetical protein DFH29DRAFT_235955 [Suillus ampliporus]
MWFQVDCYRSLQYLVLKLHRPPHDQSTGRDQYYLWHCSPTPQWRRGYLKTIPKWRVHNPKKKPSHPLFLIHIFIMFLPDGRLLIAPKVTLKLLTPSSQPSDTSDVTDVSRRQAPTTSVPPPRPAEDPLYSAKVIPQKRRARSDMAAYKGSDETNKNESVNESMDIDSEELHNQSDWEMSSPDPRAAAPAHSLTHMYKSRAFTPL